MGMKSLKDNIDVARSVRPDQHTASVNGTGVDLLGYEGAMALVLVGTVTDGTHTPKLQDSDDNSTFADVAAGFLHGSFAAAVTNTQQRVSYIGSKRYIRGVMTVAGATTGAETAIAIIRSRPAQAPLS